MGNNVSIKQRRIASMLFFLQFIQKAMANQKVNSGTRRMKGLYSVASRVGSSAVSSSYTSYSVSPAKQNNTSGDKKPNKRLRRYNAKVYVIK